MSGPKTSHYTLTAEQRRILREQAERERKINEEQVRLKKTLNAIKQVKSALQEPLLGIEELQRRTGKGSEYIQETQAIIDSINNTIGKKFYVEKDVDLNRLIEERKYTEKVLQNANNKLSVLTKQAITLNNALTDDINKGIDMCFSFADVFDKSVISESVLDKSEYENVLNDLRLITVLPKEYMVEIYRAKEKLMEIENEDFLKNFKAMTIAPLDEKCKRYAHDYQDFGEKFEELNFKYQSLCEMAEIPLKEYTLSIESIECLEQDIKRLEGMIMKEKEDAYISDTIDEVMIEMGYDLIGSRDVTKKSRKHFRDELYTFSEGTAVNIRYDSEGKITMELGGIDNTDRIPTESEIDKLCDDMESFCDGFTEIEKRLKAKGVVCKNRISILPPESEYAQIINIQDYNMSVEAKTISTESGKTRAEKRNYLRNE